MSTDDYNQVFGGGASARPSFVQRTGRAEMPSPEPPNEVAGTSPYRPYGFMPAGTNECCDVQRWVDGTQTPEGIEFQYRFLMQIAYVGEEQIKLFLPDCIVVIEGRHLHELRKKLARRQVTFVQQYAPQVWPAPPRGEPVVTSIAVVRPEPAANFRGRSG